jgi:2-polyprenyl-3-methyl-5-hydroxy-6-metoxy-1,4-benzoquinol methylase
MMRNVSVIMTLSAETLAMCHRTINSYDRYADRYAANIPRIPSASDQAALKQIAARASPNGMMLEIGSGPGYDADFLESLGVKVRRTDATRRFLELQAARGKDCDLLNVVTDDLDGGYDAIVALCVLIHVPRDQMSQVLEKIFHWLRPGGAFLVSMRDGDGETHDDYYTAYWRRNDFVTSMASAGMSLLWNEFSIDCDGDPWNTFIATRPL